VCFSMTASSERDPRRLISGLHDDRNARKRGVTLEVDWSQVIVDATTEEDSDSIPILARACHTPALRPDLAEFYSRSTRQRMLGKTGGFIFNEMQHY